MSTWHEELASLVEDTGIVYTQEGFVKSNQPGRPSGYVADAGAGKPDEEGLKGFVKACGELLLELGKGCMDIARQNLVTDDSYIVQKLSGKWDRFSGKVGYLNDYFLPEDRNPVHAWSVVLLVAILMLSVLGVNIGSDSSIPAVKRVMIHPPAASRILLPDGRYMAYQEQGVSAERARHSLIAPHSFLFSRLAGIPGVAPSLLEEFGIRLVTYDLPGFGESDPHSSRNLNSSALDMLSLANSVGITEKFWVLGYSSGSMHAWAALKYIPDQIAGAAIFAPIISPYEPSMTKDEKSRTWEKLSSRRKHMYTLARRFPRLLSYFYHQTFLSGKHGKIDKWLSLSLGKKDQELIEEPKFEEFWHRNVEESVRQGNVMPFIEEARMQVADWTFSFEDLQVHRKCKKRGIIPWLKSMYGQAECELSGFLGPIHIWQGMDDQVVPPAMTEYVARVLRGAIVHKLPDEGHFSYFSFCNECHRQIFSTLFGTPVDLCDNSVKGNNTLLGEDVQKEPTDNTKE